jgi:hypothetical protein
VSRKFSLKQDLVALTRVPGRDVGWVKSGPAGRGQTD